ncbi:MAG: hypothetical protein BroJett029_00160 [Alphaproteobacteria bacterium]|nr:MAG: hypothetical protein BroJett029_00160 [Alphaproteobacteria bacterium]
MAGLRTYSTTAAANTALFPEGMAPSAVNDGMRQVQADIRGWYQDAEWIDLGHAPVYAGTTTFTLSGDQTAVYHAGRRLRAIGAAPFTIYGTVTGASYASETTVTVAWDAGGLDNTLTRVAVGALSAANAAMPRATAAIAGAVELATDGETQAGSDPARAVTPAGLAAAAAFQGRQTIWVPATAMVARLTNGAAQGTTESAAHKVMRRSLDFDGATKEFAQFAVGMPKSWTGGTVSAEFLWTAASGSGGVIWGLQAVALSDNDTIDQAFGTAQEVGDTLLAAGDMHRSSETAPILVGGAPAAGDLIVFQVYRHPAGAADTLSADAQLIGLRLFYSTGAKNDA